MSKKGLVDELWDGIGHAVTDVRQRVVEEGWFGRIVTPGDGGADITVSVEQPAQDVPPGAPETTPSDRGGAVPAEPSPTRPPMAPPEPERQEPEQDMGR